MQFDVFRAQINAQFFVVVMKGGNKSQVGFSMLAIPHERAEDHRIFKALAFVDRGNGYQMFIAFQPEQFFVLKPPGPMSFGLQPNEQFLRAKPLAMYRSLQEIHKVPQVGKTTFSAELTGYPLPDPFLFQQVAEHDCKALLLPLLIIGDEPVQYRLPGRLVFFEKAQVHGAIAKQAGGQGGVETSFFQGIADPRQQELELPGLGRREDVFLGMDHHADAFILQGFSDNFAVSMGPDQHRNVTCRQRSVPESRFVTSAKAQKSRNLVGHRAGDKVFGLSPVRLVPKKPDGQRFIVFPGNG